jgi:arylsulfatase A-like enzyme
MPERLNVLLVSVGCLRADHVSGYGYGRDTTPFLDEIGREGVRFPNMIATAVSTLPAHATLFTGLHSVTHGATDERRFLSTPHKTLAEYVQAAGYRTAAFCTNPWVSPETGFGRGFDAFFTQRHHNRLAARALFYGRRASDRLLRRKDSGARRTNRALKRWLAASTQPFFAFVQYHEAHLPFRPPPPYDRMFLPRGVTTQRAAAVNQDCDEYIAGRAQMSEEDVAILTALYDGELRYVDTRLCEIAEFLQARGVWDRTLCVVVGDHGEHLGEHHMMGHKFRLDDTVLRVPLLLRCPERVPQGFVVDELAQTTDVLPTILRLLDLGAETGRLHGRALIDDDRATGGSGFAFAEAFRPDLSAFRRRFPAFDTRAVDVRQKVIRTKREKFIWHSDEANELYDLATDPGELDNLVERDAARADAMRRALFDWLASLDHFETGERSVQAENDQIPNPKSQTNPNG